MTDWRDFLAAAGGRVAEGGVVADHGDPEAEFRAAAEAAVLVDLGAWALLRVAGEDAATFLQGQLSCDVREVTPRASRYGSYSTPKGRMLALFLLWQAEDAYWMQLPADLAVPVRNRLSMFVLRSRVRIVDASGERVRLGVGGPRARTAVAAALGCDPGPAHQVSTVEDATVLALPGEDGPRYEIVLPAGDPARRTWTRLAAHARPAGDPVWEALAIRAGEPAVYAQTQDRLVPLFANLDLIGAVSFGKGCYPGQEIVARTHYLGRLKQRMVRARLRGPDARPRPGDDLYSDDLAGQATGTVVRSSTAPSGTSELLAVLRIDSAVGHPVHWKRPDGPVLELLPLPYAVDPSLDAALGRTG